MFNEPNRSSSSVPVSKTYVGIVNRFGRVHIPAGRLLTSLHPTDEQIFMKFDIALYY